ncbi:MAG: Unknown protein [uncultured Thiotrichaceae bacterium]|uniref:Peptidase M12B domain-containing protein n=1 Tax=uncultured Thiotrichaceae bacterium TaxID=298394 RepID=A0A6S6U152_9GAMM|nr:MAG: Unknown protein [uncultured Thiotrichaceae bacterium]
MLKNIVLSVCLMSFSLEIFALQWEAINEHDHHANQTRAVNNTANLWRLENVYPGDFSQGSEIPIPLPDNSQITVRLEETSVLAPVLAEKYPSLKTYRLISTDDNVVVGRMELIDGQPSASLLIKGETVVIQLAVNHVDSVYRVATEKQLHAKSSVPEHQCHLDDYAGLSERTENRVEARSTTNLAQQLVTYRLAVSSTLAFTNHHGGTRQGAMAAIAKTVNRVNHIFERDTGIRFQLVADNDQLIVTAADVNPFSGQLDTMLFQNQGFTDSIIGRENYDIGHVFNLSTGGLAFVHGACRSNNKAMGISGHVSGAGDTYDIDFVAHEIAHQLGATHTFGGANGWCASNERNRYSAYEPGSGSSIMSYAGLCGSDNLQNTADALLHIGSIRQIVKHRDHYLSQQCGVAVERANTAPQVDAGRDYIIPAYTPFVLKGEANDSDGDALRYNWQQTDTGLEASINTDTGDNALYRSYPASNHQQRIFPAMNVILGKERILGETIPTTSRSLNFSFIVQDARGATVADEMRIQTIKTSKVFGLHPAISYPRDKVFEVTWNVAETHLPPVSCALVDIHLSLDDGKSFNYPLALNVMNNGSAAVRLPDNLGIVTTGRLKLSCSDSIFFSVSAIAFAVSDRLELAPQVVAPLLNTATVSTNEVSASAAGAYNFHHFILMIVVFLLRLRLKFVPIRVKRAEKASSKKRIG